MFDFHTNVRLDMTWILDIVGYFHHERNIHSVDLFMTEGIPRSQGTNHACIQLNRNKTSAGLPLADTQQPMIEHEQKIWRKERDLETWRRAGTRLYASVHFKPCQHALLITGKRNILHARTHRFA